MMTREKLGSILAIAMLTLTLCVGCSTLQAVDTQVQVVADPILENWAVLEFAKGVAETLALTDPPVYAAIHAAAQMGITVLHNGGAIADLMAVPDMAKLLVGEAGTLVMGTVLTEKTRVDLISFLSEV